MRAHAVAGPPGPVLTGIGAAGAAAEGAVRREEFAGLLVGSVVARWGNARPRTNPLPVLSGAPMSTECGLASVARS